MKAQITIFIMLGVLVLVVVISAIYFMLREKLIQPETEDLSSIKSIMQSCVEQATKNAFIQFGKQGGKADINNGLKKDSVAVPFLITRNPLLIREYDGAPFLSNQPPIYPWKTFPYNPLTGEVNFEQTAVFGWNKLRSIEQLTKELSELIKRQALAQCSNIPLPVFLNLNDLKVNTLFGQKDIVVSISGINAKMQSNKFSKISEIQVRLPVNMMQLYFFLRTFLDNEVNNAKHTFQQETYPFSVITEKNEGHTLVSLADPSLDLGVPFFFQFAIENRPPALFYINQSLIDANLICPETKITLDQPNKLIVTGGVPPLIKLNGEELSESEFFARREEIFTRPCFEHEFNLKATDPDEDEFSFSIDQGTLSVSEQEYQNLCIIPITVRVKDAISSDSQQLRFRVKPKGGACIE